MIVDLRLLICYYPSTRKVENGGSVAHIEDVFSYGGGIVEDSL